MADIAAPVKSEAAALPGHSPGVVLQSTLIGLTAFLTVVDLFATRNDGGLSHVALLSGPSARLVRRDDRFAVSSG